MADDENGAPFPDRFRSEDHGDVYHLFCRVCGRGWSLKKSSTGPGNRLALLDHAASHEAQKSSGDPFRRFGVRVSGGGRKKRPWRMTQQQAFVLTEMGKGRRLLTTDGMEPREAWLTKTSDPKGVFETVGEPMVERMHRAGIIEYDETMRDRDSTSRYYRVTDVGLSELARWVEEGKPVTRQVRKFGSYLRYYAEEKQRLKGVISGAPASIEEARLAVKRLARRFFGRGVPEPSVNYTYGKNRRSTANYLGWQIVLNRNWAGWQTVAHEFAHLWLSRDRRKGKAKPGRAHCKQHARRVDRAVRYIVKMGWPSGGLVEAQARRDDKKFDRARAKAAAIAADPRSPLVTKRNKEIEKIDARLVKNERERKRLLRLRGRKVRSLRALERNQKKAAQKNG